MKRIIFVFVIVLLYRTDANAQFSVAEQLADKIATRLKDSLSLTDEQKRQLYELNMNLHNQKLALRQQYGSSDSLRNYMQRVENTRDSLYRPVLGEEKYNVYRQRKKNLINNN